MRLVVRYLSTVRRGELLQKETGTELYAITHKGMTNEPFRIRAIHDNSYRWYRWHGTAGHVG